MLVNEKLRDPTGPSTVTVKRLFAHSGNRCAFPRCLSSIIDGKTIVGEVCHIKAANVGGPRYDPKQTAAARHAYENLILLCSNHHVVVDDDPEAYTVERLIKMKNDHEQRTSLLSGEQVESVSQEIRLLIDQSVTALNQSGGITAHTVHINVNAASVEPRTVPTITSPARFPATEPKDGQARFRLPDQPLGIHWNTMPFANEMEHQISFSIGPAMWLRLLPRVVPVKNWSATDLLNCATRGGGLSLQPFYWKNLEYLRAEDGFGLYAFSSYRDSSTDSVVFVFESGEVWSVDTSLLVNSQKRLFFESIASAFMERLKDYGVFLQKLGLEPPFDWIAGLEGVKGWRLQGAPLSNQLSAFRGNTCLTEIVTARGTYDVKRASGTTLWPFFDQIFRKCSTQFPDHLKHEISRS